MTVDAVSSVCSRMAAVLSRLAAAWHGELLDEIASDAFYECGRHRRAALVVVSGMVAWHGVAVR